MTFTPRYGFACSGVDRQHRRYPVRSGVPWHPPLSCACLDGGGDPVGDALVDVGPDFRLGLPGVAAVSHLAFPLAAKQRPCGALLPGAARAVGLEGEKGLLRDPAARSRSTCGGGGKLGGSSLRGREGATPLGPLYAASAAMCRVSDESPSRPRRRLSAGSGRSPPARPERGDAQAAGATSSDIQPNAVRFTLYILGGVGYLDEPFFDLKGMVEVLRPGRHVLGDEQCL